MAFIGVQKSYRLKHCHKCRNELTKDTFSVAVKNGNRMTNICYDCIKALARQLKEALR